MRNVFVYIISFLFVLSGCSSHRVTYSNLYDKETRNVVQKEFSECKEISRVLDWAQLFNDTSVHMDFQSGFVSIPSQGLDYSNVYLDDTKDSFEFLSWLNCRLTAFTLMKNFIQTNESGKESDVWLMFDCQAIQTVPEFSFLKSDSKDFMTLFNSVSVQKTKTVEEHGKRIEEAWINRSIQIDGPYSLVCVYIHAPEDAVRFVGHTGVLKKTSDGLLFIEKYGSLAPYVVTRFKDRAELKDYLLSRDDLYGDSTELAPIITENGQVI